MLSSRVFPYSSVGQYVIEAATGIRIEGAYTLPNSNLILEVLFTSGLYGGLIIYLAELGCFYRLRFRTLTRPITPFSLVAVTTTIFDPMGLFFSGQEWVVEAVLVLLVIMAALVLTQGIKVLRTICAATRVQRAAISLQ